MVVLNVEMPECCRFCDLLGENRDMEDCCNITGERFPGGAPKDKRDKSCPIVAEYTGEAISVKAEEGK